MLWLFMFMTDISNSLTAAAVQDTTTVVAGTSGLPGNISDFF
jgi:hypothetical protein